MRGFATNGKLYALLELLILLAGMAMISYGAALVYLPAGFIVGGVLLVLAGIDARTGLWDLFSIVVLNISSALCGA